MIFIDASVLVAVLTREDDAAELSARIFSEPRRVTSAIAVWEAATSVTRKLTWTLAEARGLVDRLLEMAEIRLVPIGTVEAALALEAFDRFGKGRHPARLNMGDCFAYACAKANDASLLFKGDDFTKTDVSVA